ncbi:amino acid ABC transporter substrate-binding protein, PAAT family [Malonomonas rubra DSM 5091]|uniref:Amino acid ABC transporter substrate-binding protein, PAAT family n=1 Tax=Malonomonas rubra DSM 5091 TaxID=1122189 RepID=A0A1M6G8G7_MALRU|nr:transporter substrate-binding domain-containing protein [Malonomonas rubra]SHJ06229.1 amino acid ABC transporter substrate-binding protein, PAAT family [Malonomonas rubra DSM 5091]
MRKWLFSSILCLLTLVSSASAEVRQLQISISTGYPPFYFFTEDDQPAGICIDIIDQVAEKMGIKVEYVSYPWKRMLEYGRTGEVDAVLPLFQTREREQFLLFPAEALVIEENRFFTSAGSSVTYSGQLSDVTDYSIGVVDGFSYGSQFDQIELEHKIVSETLEQLIRLVAYQRVDLAIGNSKVINYTAHLMAKADQIRFLSPPVTADPLFIGFSKEKIDPAFVARFSDALREFKATEAYARILQPYGL